jgi:hypothetical protein
MRRALTLGLAVFATLVACGASDDNNGSPPATVDAGADRSVGPSSSGGGAHDASGTSSYDASGGQGADAGGSSGADASSGATDAGYTFDASPGKNAIVTAFDNTLFAFGSKTDPSASRRQTAPAAFPSGGTFKSIKLEIALTCPAGGCDHWDRVGSLGIVTQAPVDGGTHGAVVEIARFVTPFCSAATYDYDVTDLAPLLVGNATLQGFIDTWSPQGDPANNGAGWQLNATFTFTGGTTGKIPIADIPFWTWPADGDPPNYQYGDPNDPISNHLTPQTLNVPVPGASSYALRTIITGHGQGNANNCGEFCQSTHTLTLGSSPYKFTPSYDCTKTPNGPSQCGTWDAPRSSWCPGQAVAPWTQKVTLGSGPTTTLTYTPDGYVNTCRPDEASCDTNACVFGTGCAYNGGMHTTPVFYVSTMLVAYH